MNSYEAERKTDAVIRCLIDCMTDLNRWTVSNDRPLKVALAKDDLKTALKFLEDIERGIKNDH